MGETVADLLDPLLSQLPPAHRLGDADRRQVGDGVKTFGVGGISQVPQGDADAVPHYEIDSIACRGQRALTWALATPGRGGVGAAPRPRWQAQGAGSRGRVRIPYVRRPPCAGLDDKTTAWANHWATLPKVAVSRGKRALRLATWAAGSGVMLWTMGWRNCSSPRRVPCPAVDVLIDAEAQPRDDRCHEASPELIEG